MAPRAVQRSTMAQPRVLKAAQYDQPCEMHSVFRSQVDAADHLSIEKTKRVLWRLGMLSIAAVKMSKVTERKLLQRLRTLTMTWGVSLSFFSAHLSRRLVHTCRKC